VTDNTKKTKGSKIPLDALEVTSIRRSDRIPHIRGIFQLRSDYNAVHGQQAFAVKKRRESVPFNPNSLSASEKMLSTCWCKQQQKQQ